MLNSVNEMWNTSKELITLSFVTPAESHRMSYATLKKKLAATSYQENSYFRQGLLLETIEKGVTYPVVHRGSLQNYFQKQEFGNDGGKINYFDEHANNFVIEKGCYQEVESIHADLFGRPLDDLLAIRQGDLLLNKTWGRFFLLLGFKQLPSIGKTEVLENHWKEWTGARYLYLNLPDEFGLSRLTFYKRFTPNDFNLFLYVVLVECIHVTPSDETPLQDFVQRMRADKMPFYLALYKESPASLLNAEHPTQHRTKWRSSSRSTGNGSPNTSSLEDIVSSPSTNMASSPIFGFSTATFRSEITFRNF